MDLRIAQGLSVDPVSVFDISLFVLAAILSLSINTEWGLCCGQIEGCTRIGRRERREAVGEGAVGGSKRERGLPLPLEAILEALV